MTRQEYMHALEGALRHNGCHSHVVTSDKIVLIARTLPTKVLQAVVNNDVFYEDGGPVGPALAGTPITFHPSWVEACDDELSDRILTESLKDDN